MARVLVIKVTRKKKNEETRGTLKRIIRGDMLQRQTVNRTVQNTSKKEQVQESNQSEE